MLSFVVAGQFQVRTGRPIGAMLPAVMARIEQDGAVRVCFDGRTVTLGYGPPPIGAEPMRFRWVDTWTHAEKARYGLLAYAHREAKVGPIYSEVRDAVMFALWSRQAAGASSARRGAPYPEWVRRNLLAKVAWMAYWRRRDTQLRHDCRGSW